MTGVNASDTWIESALLDLVTIKSGQVDPRDAKYRELPLIAPDHIASGTGRLLKKESAAAQGAISGKYLVRPGDVIYSKIRPYLQKAYKCDFEALCSADMYPLTPRHDTDSSFILHTLLGHNFTNFAVSVSARSGIPKINREELAEYRMRVPNGAEQRKIGRALDDADALISTLERLIAKKQAIKQGMMQQLLTGATRLPGFSAEWTEHDLGELGRFLKGRGVKRDDVRSTGVPCIRYGEIYTEFGDYTAHTRSYVSREIAGTALPLRMGDVLFAGSGETKTEIGTALAYIGERDAVAGGDIIVLRGTGYNSVFLSSLLNSPRVAAQKARKGQGDAVVHISSAALGGLKVQLPECDEQDAIATVIQDADREIGALHLRLEKARSIKQGMMQELLTGKTQLEVKEVE